VCQDTEMIRILTMMTTRMIMMRKTMSLCGAMMMIANMNGDGIDHVRVIVNVIVIVSVIVMSVDGYVFC